MEILLEEKQLCKIEKVEILQEKEKQLADYVLLQELPPPAISKITCKMQLLGGVSFPYKFQNVIFFYIQSFKDF